MASTALEATALMTLEEQEKILLIAEGLIRQPENWCMGNWKCAIDEKGMPVSEEDLESGKKKQAVDDNGRPQFQYCIEGAVNEACLTVLGKDRAIQVGAITVNDKGQINYTGGEGVVGHDPAMLLGLDELASELYASDMGWDNDDPDDGRYTDPEDRCAMNYNDDGGSHEGVLKLLRTQLKRVRASMGR
jgi:hypothetical protein